MIQQASNFTFVLTLITKDPSLAKLADQSDVDRIGVDLEYKNKSSRQAGLQTRISDHSLSDLKKISEVVSPGKVFVRINPLSNFSEQEIEDVLALGAKFVMLPYFTSAKELEAFVRALDGRAQPIALLETSQAVIRINEILRVEGVSEIMLGLNDLRVAFGVNNHFEVLASPIVSMLSDLIRSSGKTLFIGGVAPPDFRHLPVDPSLVLAQYPRLSASGAWIARSFFEANAKGPEIACGIKKIRSALNEFAVLTPERLEEFRSALEAKSTELSYGGASL